MSQRTQRGYWLLPVSFFISLSLLVGPFGVSFLHNAPLLKTKRLNDQRAPVASTQWLRPGETLEYSFVATENALREIRLFLRPALFVAWTDSLSVTLEDTDTGETIYASEISSGSLWDDVATFRFDPVEDSQGKHYELTLRADLFNRSNFELATDYADSSQWIFQPYYELSDSFSESLSLVGQRLGWRLAPFIFLLPLLMGFCLHVFRTLLRAS